MATKKLRAAGYCRTSGEGQRGNTSIPFQKDEVTAFIERNGWSFTSFYVDESKTGSKIAGRADFQRMLRDAERDKFDVIVSWQINRFARDGVDMLSTAKDLKAKYGISVVDTTGGFDNRDINNTLTNFVNAGVSENERLTILKRTFNGRIRTAQAGHLAVGTRPVGRAFDKKTKTWSVIEDVKKKYETIARRCLKGESLQKLADEYGMNHSNLHENLKYNCGDTWNQRLSSKTLEIEMVFPTPVPRLLDDRTIAAIRKKIEANKTYAHGNSKHDYLLNRMIFCDYCGKALTGGHKHGTRVYRHGTKYGAGECPVQPRPWVRADEVEDLVLRQLFECFGNPKAVKKAIEDAVPNLAMIEDHRERIAELEVELVKIATKRERQQELYTDGKATKAETHRKLDELTAKAAKINDEIERRQVHVATLPTPELYRGVTDCVYRLITSKSGKKRKMSSARVAATVSAANSDYDSMSWDDKKELVQTVFGGKTVDGKRMGIYIAWRDLDSEKRRDRRAWEFTLYGHLPGGDVSVTSFARTTRSTTIPIKSRITRAIRSSKNCPTARSSRWVRRGARLDKSF